jgi:hypothetical protein
VERCSKKVLLAGIDSELFRRSFLTAERKERRERLFYYFFFFGLDGLEERERERERESFLEETTSRTVDFRLFCHREHQTLLYENSPSSRFC